ncbi:MAG: preprotein translocase subunit SecG [Pseudomonadota bacterium]
MENLENILLALLVVDAIALVVLVLLQQGRGADVGAAFGGGASNTMFGSGGSGSFLVKLTTWLTIGFFGISFGLAYSAKQRSGALPDAGIPTISAPASGLDFDAAVDDAAAEIVPQVEDAEETAGAIAEELTDEAEAVDSDIPDV